MKLRPYLLPSSALGLLALGFVACANRGMYTVTGDGGGTGGAGAGGRVDGGATGGNGSGGAGGTVCVPGGADAGTCTATYNFENCALYGATLDDSSSQLAFKSIADVRSPAACGAGAMEISAAFSGSAALPDGGQNLNVYGSLSIPLNIDLRGKTITIHLMAVPATTGMTIFYAYPLTSAGYYPDPTILRVSPIPSTWTTKSFTFETSADAGLMNAISLLIQTRSLDGYVGKIYVDEIDISTPSPDGGTDGPRDAAGN